VYEPEPQSQPEPQQAPASTSGGGALGIDIPGFQDLAPAVYIEKEFEQQVVPSTRAENGTWAARVRAEDAAQHAEHTRRNRSRTATRC
jgi:hypothetical protein